MIRTIKNIIFILLYTSFVNAQSFTTHNYTPSSEIIGNPERGFYHQITSVTNEKLLNFKKDGVRLILVNYSLKGFHNKALNADFLQNLERDLNTVRNAGFKIIIRFAYSFTETNNIPDAPLDIVLLHISQLKTILNKNSDVILTLQAGFIGTWGEWWNTYNYSMSPGYITEDNWIDRREVVDALLDVMPKDRMVQLRTPFYKRNILKEADYIPIESNNAFDESMRSRIGHHNDCFVAGNFDYGTYKDTTLEKPYLHLETQYTFMGGETCHKGADAHCDNAIKELKRFHWSYLNLDYHQGVLNQWKQEGCYDEVEEKLGYRYEMIESNLQSNGKPGGKIDFTIKIKNIGWANPNNAYKLQLILKNNESNTVYRLQVEEDIRTWALNETNTLSVSAGLPEDLATGEYKAYISFKDDRLSLRFNPDYSIQFANQDLWNANTGNNDLQHNITISNDNSLPNYNGSNLFEIEGKTTPGFEGPEAMKITEYNNNNIIYWTTSKNTSSQRLVKLLRAKDNGDFQVIAIQNLNETSYTDRNLTANVNYTYKTQYIETDRNSEYTSINIIKSNNAERSFVNIELDGIETDWDIVKPVATGYLDGLSSLKFVNNVENLFFYIETPNLESYQIDLMINNDTNFIIRNDSLFKNTNNDYIFRSLLTINQSSNFIEGSVRLEDINFGNPSLTGNIRINGSEINDLETPFYFLKYKILETPENFKVTPSVVTPLSKVKIGWKLNSNVEGYFVERSIGDTDHYEIIKNLGSGNNYYLDKNLDKSKQYYYRIFSYSDITRSKYTDDFAIKLDPNAVANHENEIIKIEISPNPMLDKANLKIQTKETIDCQILLYDSKANYITTLFTGKITDEVNIPINNLKLPKGIYFIHIKNNFHITTQKIIIQ